MWLTGVLSVDLRKIAVGDLNRDGLADIVFEDRMDVAGEPRRTVVLLNRSNRPPLAAAGPDRTVECESPAGALVTLDGSASSDPDSTPTESDIVEYAWYEDRGLPGERLLGLGAVVTVTLGLGPHAVTLVVRDKQGATGEDALMVVVEDTLPPDLAVRVRPDVLWPPNHKLVPVCIDLEAADACDAAPLVRLVAATSSEPDDAPGGKDGKTRGDIRDADLGTPDTQVLLRAERDNEARGASTCSSTRRWTTRGT